MAQEPMKNDIRKRAKMFGRCQEDFIQNSAP